MQIDHKNEKMNILKNASGLMLLLMIASQNLMGQGKPAIEGFGQTFEVENPGFETNKEMVYKVVFDIHGKPDDPSKVNPYINTLARFINMHTKAGVPLENLKVVGVFHNKASVEVLDNAAYKEKFGVDNPNIPLIKALREAGADLYMCGQSMAARNVPKEKMVPEVETALSAMTVFLNLQAEGYQLIRF